MPNFFFCYSASADRTLARTRDLTPRALMLAGTRMEAHKEFREACEQLWYPTGRPPFGMASFRQETKREHARVTDPCDILPWLEHYIVQRSAPPE